MWPMENTATLNLWHSNVSGDPTLTLTSMKDHVNDYSSFAPLELPILLNQDIFNMVIVKDG